MYKKLTYNQLNNPINFELQNDMKAKSIPEFHFFCALSSECPDPGPIYWMAKMNDIIEPHIC
jgi:hypothetical protein